MDNDFECVVCRKTFPTKQEYEEHISEHHDGFKNNVPVCKYFRQGRCTREQCAFRHPQRQHENQWPQQVHQRHYLNQQQQQPLNQPQQQPQHGWLANCRRGPVHS